MSLKHTFALFALLAAPAFSTTITFGTGGTTGFTTGGVNSVVVNDANLRFYEPAPGRNYVIGAQAKLGF